MFLVIIHVSVLVTAVSHIHLSYYLFDPSLWQMLQALRLPQDGIGHPDQVSFAPVSYLCHSFVLLEDIREAGSNLPCCTVIHLYCVSGP